MNYQEQLQTQEWKLKRQVILERDNFRCTKCKCERSKFLGLSRNFGIKTFQQLKDAGYSISIEFPDNKGFMLSYKNFWNVASFVGESPDKIKPENLKFALQSTYENPHDKNSPVSKEIICFLEPFSENQIFTDLNIHHKFYIIDKLAWEYEDSALITLCSSCHQDEHENNEIFVYTQSGNEMYKTHICGKCGGSGFIPEFDYYQNGVCFNCHGHGVSLK